MTSRQGEKIVLTPNAALFSDFSKTGPPDYDDYYQLLTELGDKAQGTRSNSLVRRLTRLLVGGEASLDVLWTECPEHEVPRKGATASIKRNRRPLSALRCRSISGWSITSSTWAISTNLFGKLAEDHCDLDVFIETKSNLQKRQIKTLAAGGVKCMQPGSAKLECQ